MAKKFVYAPADSGMVQQFVKNLKKECGPELTLGSEIKEADAGRQSISTGSTKLDWALVKPFVEGTINEIHGPNKAGKTTLALEVAANATLMGKPVFFFDLERKLVDSQLDMIKRLDRNLFFRIRPSTGEDAANKVLRCVSDVAGCVVIFDSLTQMLPEVEDAESVEKQTMGLVARLAAKMVRKILGPVERNRCMVLFISHITTNMDQYDYTEKTKGGNAVPDISAQRIRLSVSTSEKKMIKDDSGNPIGQNTKCKIVKNNQGRAYREVEVPIIWGKGIDRTIDLYQVATEIGAITQSGSWFYHGDEKFQGSQAIIDKIKTDVDFRNKLITDVKAFL